MDYPNLEAQDIMMNENENYLNESSHLVSLDDYTYDHEFQYIENNEDKEEMNVGRNKPKIHVKKNRKDNMKKNKKGKSQKTEKPTKNETNPNNDYLKEDTKEQREHRWNYSPIDPLQLPLENDNTTSTACNFSSLFRNASDVNMQYSSQPKEDENNKKTLHTESKHKIINCAKKPIDAKNCRNTLIMTDEKGN